MTSAQTHSWLLLALSFADNGDGARVPQISLVADGINHAVPTQRELRDSLQWLIAHALVEKRGRRYFITETGHATLRTARSNTQKMSEVWDAISSQLTDLGAGR